MNSAYFVTGTDTEVGKTFCTEAMLYLARNSGLKAVGYKPIASGVEKNGLNTDVLALQRASYPLFDYSRHNIYTFAEATAPHLAAADSGVEIDMQRISSGLYSLKEQVDMVLVEGAGGWHTPLSMQADFSDWVVCEQLPVILVVGMKLGCINHALLTAESVCRSGLPLVGWVGNCINEQPHRLADYIKTLQSKIAAPLLGVVPYRIDGRVQDIACNLQPWW
ncbi:dethiobiotin synthetase [Neisseria arctica]|uniref:ATP-dependent dethiobiotin synthetase BioD n=1 Tax=Neisseria arctica TaxID=1470200 RepID=A0A0J1C2L4_9NEIS|nr:dethiobiotin synthase [Neisseria arctica]KLT72483.1 dethiobiotin synthetase [Neisseria arctica]UOO86385.1 dethiobiotin synthase [Neisseria arctica]